MTDHRHEPIGYRHSPHSLANRVMRVLWALVYVLLFRPSLRNLHGWRNWLLRTFGAKLHRTSRVYPRARIWAPWNLSMAEYACISDDVDVYAAERITIGAHSTVSQYTYLCGATHDYEDVHNPLVPLPITIGRRCWVAADVFVAPGVTIGDGTIVGARSSVFKNLPAWSIVMGSPARVIRPRRLGPADFGMTAENPDEGAADA